MKKIYTMVAVALIGTSAIAQRAGNNAPGAVANPKLHVGTPVLHGQSNGERTTTWYNYALMLDDPNNGYTPGLAAGDFLGIFPDSTIIIGQYTDGSTAYAQFHKAATMLDPKNMPFSAWNTSNQYKLDSVAIAYAYLRALPTNVIDTLQVQIIKHDASLEWDLTNASYQDITYTYGNNTITQSQVLGTYTYLLGDADSSNYVNEILLATPGIPAQNGANRIGVVVSFKPGYTWTPLTDSLVDKNAFYVFSYEQNGLGTDPTFYGTIGTGSSDYNCSYALPTSVRYNYNANGWNGYFIPTWAWTTPYSTEHHIISFLLNDVVGVEEQNTVSLASAYPNPSNGNSFVDYALKADAKVTLNITDITGKVVMSINEGNKQQGEYRVNLNTTELAAGTYFININANDAKATSKLVVMK